MLSVERYLAELTRRLRNVLGEELVGVYAGGSYAVGGYVPGRSDLDVAVVVRDRLAPAVVDALVADVRHEALPCPARGLELVVYPRAAVRTATAEPGFLLNLNTGAGMTFRAETDPAGAERHWFPLDRSILARHGAALAGPPAAEMFASLPRPELLRLLVDALEWHGAGSARGDDVVLNAARALRYAVEETWSSKEEAGRWALATLGDAAAVEQALAARAGGTEVDDEAAERFRAVVLERLREPLAGARRPPYHAPVTPVAFRFGNATFRLGAEDADHVREQLQHRSAVPEGAAALADELAEGRTELAPTRDEELELLEVLRAARGRSAEWDELLACLEQRAAAA